MVVPINSFERFKFINQQSFGMVIKIVISFDIFTILKIKTCTENQGNLYLKHLVNWYVDIVHTFYIIIYLNILCPNINNSPQKECLTRKCYVWANLLNKSKREQHEQAWWYEPAGGWLHGVW